MILEPWKSAEEIDRRLSALNDPELADLLRAASREFMDDHSETYAAPSAPYWKKRIGLIALAGLIAMSAGYAGTVSNTRHQRAAVKLPAAAAPRHQVKRAAHHAAPLHQKAVAHHAAPVVYHRTAFAPVRPAVPAAPSEAAIRQARAQVLHERAIAAQAQAEAARAHHQAQLAMQAQARANQQALEEALARARAQARAEAVAKVQSEAFARAQAEDTAARQQQALQNATDPNIKPGDGIPPPVTGKISTIPSPNHPAPAPGPIDPNCTPHRGSLFPQVLLDHVRVGGTSVGGLLRLIHNP